jgi:two-component system sensor histidine kinase AlgZ
MPAQPSSGHASSLPDFSNLGVALRIVTIVEAVLVFMACAKGGDVAGTMRAFIDLSAIAQPCLLVALLGLALANGPLHRLSYAASCIAVTALAVVAALLVRLASDTLFPDLSSHPGHIMLTATFVTVLVLGYFHLRFRAFAPALVEARLTALQARIRPHFLFNTLNTVLSLIRYDPKRAEQTLQDLSDLFRVAMSDTGKLVRLDSEIALAQQYMAIEGLRLGSRLSVSWHVENAPVDAGVPPLILQPLLENAVYHGVEPLEGGEVNVNAYLSRGQVHIVVRNPVAIPKHPPQGGHRIALDNIRERLALHFDLEAGLESRIVEGQYEVRVVLPYRKAAP